VLKIERERKRESFACGEEGDDTDVCAAHVLSHSHTHTHTHTTITPEIAAAGAVKHALSCSSFTSAATDSNKSPIEVFKVINYYVFNFLILHLV